MRAYRGHGDVLPPRELLKSFARGECCGEPCLGARQSEGSDQSLGVNCKGARRVEQREHVCCTACLVGEPRKPFEKNRRPAVGTRDCQGQSAGRGRLREPLPCAHLHGHRPQREYAGLDRQRLVFGKQGLGRAICVHDSPAGVDLDDAEGERLDDAVLEASGHRGGDRRRFVDWPRRFRFANDVQGSPLFAANGLARFVDLNHFDRQSLPHSPCSRSRLRSGIGHYVTGIAGGLEPS